MAVAHSVDSSYWAATSRVPFFFFARIPSWSLQPGLLKQPPHCHIAVRFAEPSSAQPPPPPTKQSFLSPAPTVVVSRLNEPQLVSGRTCTSVSYNKLPYDITCRHIVT